MRALRWIFLAGIFFISTGVNAQAKLGITIDSLPSQITFLDTGNHNYNLYIKNYGDSAFDNTVSLLYSVNGAVYSADTQGTGFYFQSGTITIAPQATYQTTVGVNFNLPAFETVGSSAVVIWPISGAAATYDSVYYSVQVLPAGVNNISTVQLRVYINQQQLFIQTNAQNLLSRVRIYDIGGQLVLEQGISSSTTIPLTPFTSGYYLVEVILNDGTRQVYKLINMVNR